MGDGDLGDFWGFGGPGRVFCLVGVSGPLCRWEIGIGAVFRGLGGSGRGFSLVGLTGPLSRWEMGIGAVFGGLGGLEGVFL